MVMLWGGSRRSTRIARAGYSRGCRPGIKHDHEHVAGRHADLPVGESEDHQLDHEHEDHEQEQKEAEHEWERDGEDHRWIPITAAPASMTPDHTAPSGRRRFGTRSASSR